MKLMKEVRKLSKFSCIATHRMFIWVGLYYSLQIKRKDIEVRTSTCS